MTAYVFLEVRVGDAPAKRLVIGLYGNTVRVPTLPTAPSGTPLPLTTRTRVLAAPPYLLLHPLPLLHAPSPLLHPLYQVPKTAFNFLQLCTGAAGASANGAPGPLASAPHLRHLCCRP